MTRIGGARHATVHSFSALVRKQRGTPGDHRLSCAYVDCSLVIHSLGGDMSATAASQGVQRTKLTEPLPRSLRTPIIWGVGVGIVQAFSPIGFWWLSHEVVWAIALAIIAPVYVGLAVADGRSHVIAVEIGVALAFIILAMAAIGASPWLVVAGLVGHGLKDLWQHRTHFVVNTRWWPPFCLVVDFVAAGVIAALLIGGIDLGA
jgi:hypothetical protein